MVFDLRRFGCWIYHVERSKDGSLLSPCSCLLGDLLSKYQASSGLDGKWA